MQDFNLEVVNIWDPILFLLFPARRYLLSNFNCKFKTSIVNIAKHPFQFIWLILYILPIFPHQPYK